MSELEHHTCGREGWQPIEVGEATTLAACPIGLFVNSYGGLCLKTEYGNNEGRIDAYIVSSGEFFWGTAPQTIANQRRQVVRPVSIAPRGHALGVDSNAGDIMSEIEIHELEAGPTLVAKAIWARIAELGARPTAEAGERIIEAALRCAIAAEREGIKRSARSSAHHSTWGEAAGYGTAWTTHQDVANVIVDSIRNSIDWRSVMSQPGNSARIEQLRAEIKEQLVREASEREQTHHQEEPPMNSPAKMPPQAVPPITHPTSEHHVVAISLEAAQIVARMIRNGNVPDLYPTLAAAQASIPAGAPFRAFTVRSTSGRAM